MRDPFDIPLETNRRRTSAKWTRTPPGALPLWVAEMDVTLAEPIAARLHEAIDLGDTGYMGDPAAFFAAFAGFAERRWGWRPDPSRATAFADLHVMAVHLVRRLTQLRGHTLRVAVTPPVYNSFYGWLDEAGAEVVEVPLLAPETGGRLDLTALERAFADGLDALLLSSPHNPTGAVWSAADLAALADAADRHGALVIADEIHAPLTHPGVTFTPYLSVSDAARRTGIALHAPSKAWNLAGLKASLLVTAPGGPDLGLDGETAWQVGQFGALAGRAAYEAGEPWLAEVTAQLAARAAFVGEFLARELPEVGYHPPQASYLVWLDLRRALPGDATPAQTILARTDLMLSEGSIFGAIGTGWVRMNIATSYEILDDALGRLARALRG